MAVKLKKIILKSRLLFKILMSKITKYFNYSNNEEMQASLLKAEKTVVKT